MCFHNAACRELIHRSLQFELERFSCQGQSFGGIVSVLFEYVHLAIFPDLSRAFRFSGLMSCIRRGDVAVTVKLIVGLIIVLQIRWPVRALSAHGC